MAPVGQARGRALRRTEGQAPLQDEAEQLRLALPSEERLLGPTRDLLTRAGLDLQGYDSSTRRYHMQVGGPVAAAAAMLRDRDIPVQVGVGNYDLGVCSLMWIDELLALYPSSGLVKLLDLGTAPATVYAARWGRDAAGGAGNREAPVPGNGPLRVVTEHPNLTERFVQEQRLPHTVIFPVWDRAEVYLPEHADLAVLAASDPGELASLGLRPVTPILRSTAFLVAHAASLERRDMGLLLERLARAARSVDVPGDPASQTGAA